MSNSAKAEAFQQVFEQLSVGETSAGGGGGLLSLEKGTNCSPTS